MQKLDTKTKRLIYPVDLTEVERAIKKIFAKLDKGDIMNEKLIRTQKKILTLKLAKEYIKYPRLHPDLHLPSMRYTFASFMKSHTAHLDNIKANASVIYDVFCYTAKKDKKRKLAILNKIIEKLGGDPYKSVRDEFAKLAYLEQKTKESEYEKNLDFEDEFIWDYWKERKNLYNMLELRRPEGVECTLRAYELFKFEELTQREVAKTLVDEGLIKTCTQSNVSRLCEYVEGVVNNLLGWKYEFYVKHKLKSSVIKGVFDKNKIKEIMHLGNIRLGSLYSDLHTYPDFVIIYANCDIDIVSCKCFSGLCYAVRIEDKCRGSDIKPELEVFEKLHKGEKLKMLGGGFLKKNNNMVRLVLLFKSIHEEFNHEFYKIYKTPTEVPARLSVSRRKIKNGILHPAKWVRAS